MKKINVITIDTEPNLSINVLQLALITDIDQHRRTSKDIKKHRRQYLGVMQEWVRHLNKLAVSKAKKRGDVYPSFGLKNIYSDHYLPSLTICYNVKGITQSELNQYQPRSLREAKAAAKRMLTPKTKASPASQIVADLKTLAWKHGLKLVER